MRELIISSSLPKNSYAWCEAREILSVQNPTYKYYKELLVYRYEGVGAIHFDIQTLPKKHNNKIEKIKEKCKNLKGFMPTFIASHELSVPQKAFYDKGDAYRELRDLFEVAYIGRVAYVNILKFKTIFNTKDKIVAFVHTKDIESYALELVEIHRISKNYFLVIY